MSFIEMDKFAYLKVETDILNLKHGPYQVTGDQKKVTTSVSEGRLIKVRQNGATKYFIEKKFALVQGYYLKTS